MNEFYEEVPFSCPDELPKSSDDEFFGDSWSVRRQDGKLFFSYISGELAGRTKEIEIDESDFNDARLGKIDGDGMCIKYGVH